MKKFLTVLLILAMVFTLAACGGNGGSGEGSGTGEGSGSGEQGGTKVTSYADIPDTVESKDGTYEIAMVTDVGQLKDGSFNENTWNGCKKYASDNGLTYKYYQPANGDKATDEDRIKAMTDACEAGAKALVTPGFLQATALEAVAPKYPEVQFVFVDGWDLGFPNLVGVSFQEEQAGYLAGYAAVMNGFTKLGFSGGGGGANPACIRYGYGYVQGANDAAKEKGTKVEMRYSWEYGSTFSASTELQAMLSGWYQAGTEVVFVCGGSMFNSGVAAADAVDGKIIGVDVDQSPLSDTVVTSACKGLDASVIEALTKFYKEGLVKGSLVLGAKDNAVQLPEATWSLENWKVDEYKALFEKIKNGEVTIDNDASVSDPSTKGFENVTFIK